MELAVIGKVEVDGDEEGISGGGEEVGCAEVEDNLGVVVEEVLKFC